MKPLKIPIERLGAWVLVIGGVLFALRFFLEPLIITALPFLLAWVMAYFARPIALRLHRHTHLSIGALSVILVFLFLLICGALLYFAARQAVLELIAFGERFAGDEQWLSDLTNSAEQWWAGMADRFPFLSAFGIPRDETLANLLSDWLSSAGSRLGEAALQAAGILAAAIPNGIIFLLVTLVAAFYFALDLNGIHRAIIRVLPKTLQAAADKVKAGTWQTIGGYGRAYLILLGVTFVLLLFGFLLLRIPYAVLLAALFSLLDLLPIIGVGTLLIPWGIFACLTGDLATGVGLLALYAVIALLRQFLEPRLIGKELGLHPLLALLATYAGLKLFGFWGLMLLPGACMILRHVFISEDSQAT